MISQGIKLSYGDGDDFKELTNLQEIPELGGSKDSVEITTLSSAAHEYEDGLENYGDNLPFKFLYESPQFEELAALTGAKTWKVELPDGTTCTFGGSSSVKLDGVGVNAPLTYTLGIRPNTKMVWA